jgi:hypothetical protein
MSQKRTQYVKTSTGIEKQYISSHATIVDLDKIEGLDAQNVQEAIEQLVDISASGGVTGVKGDNETEYRQGQVNITPSNIGLGNVTNDAQVKRSEMGVAKGVATLGDDGKVPSAQLPSYVDDVLEYDNKASFPATGENGKIYVDKSTNITYRWGGTAYVEISASLALGETSSTAYAGDKGKQNADNIASLTQRTDNVEEELLKIGNGTQSVGVAEKAKQLSTARKISLSGDVAGEISFDGTSDKEMATTLANSGVYAGTYSVVSVDAKGRVTNGSQIVEWGTEGQNVPTNNLAIGGIFFELVE